MLKRTILTLICCFLPWSVSADELRLIKNAPQSYVVIKGDTLWDISAKFLKDPWLWPKLWRVNPEIQNPHLIYPGDQLNLVYDANGQPMLVKGKPNLKWSPQVRTTLKDQNPVETISLDIISPYINFNSVLTVQDIENSPYVLGSEEGYKSSMDGFKIYVNGDLQVSKAYAVYQKEEEILSPETEEVIGYHAKLVATGKAIRVGDMSSNKPSTLYIDNAIREVRSGTIVKPIDDNHLLPSFFTMQPANSGVRGQIVKSSNDVREFGKFEVIYIDQGSIDGVKQGDILSIVRKSPGVVETGDGPVYTKDASRWHRMAAASDSDYDMPEEAIGKVMVFQVFDKVSMALILRTEKALRLQDTVTAP